MPSSKLTVLVSFEYTSFLHMLENINRRGTQFHVEKPSNFVQSSHLDPIGDQNDVQQLSIYYVYLAYLVFVNCMQVVELNRH